MNLLNKLTKKNLLLNKKRTIVTVIGIILSVSLIMALSSLVASFIGSATVYEKMRSGNFHVSFDNVKSSDVDKFKNNRYVEDVYFTKEIGYSMMKNIQNEDKPYVYVLAFDFKALDNLGLSLIDGRLPQTSNEIVIPRHLKTNGRVELNIGDTITLDIGKRIGEDEYQLNQSNPYQKDSEKLVTETTQEYKIVGIIERPSYSLESFTAPGYTFVTCLDDINDAVYSAYVRYEHKYLGDYLSVTANILGVDEQLFKKGVTGNIDFVNHDELLAFYEKYEREMQKARYDFRSINDYLISLEYQTLEDSSMKALYTVAFVIIIIIIVTSVYCIKNSFNISITEKTKQYGMLASIGATKKQIKHNVLFEAFILGLIGIPVGILSGILAAYVLIKVTSALLADSLGMELSFMVSITSIVLSIVLSVITIYFSAIKSAKKASRISPISAIRNNDDIKIKSKKVKSPKLVKKVFGIGGDISYKNLKRNSKKYRTTVISIVVCVAVFIALYSFMSLAFKTVHMQFKEMKYNIGITFTSDDEDNANKLIKEIIEHEGIKDYAIYNSNGYRLINPELTKKYEDYLDIFYSDEAEQFDGTLVSLGEHQYRKYLNQLGVKYEDAVDKVIIINNTYMYNYDEKKKTSVKVDLDMFDYKAGDTLNGGYYDSDKCKENDSSSCYINYPMEIVALTDVRPLGLENHYSNEFVFIVSDELLNNIATNHGYYDLYIDALNPDKFQDDAEKILSVLGETYISNMDKAKKQEQSFFTLVAIFLYGFITVIALIGITNIFNTITTNMELRSREFATLKSVGMTKHEFNRMISLESLFYGTKSLVIGIPIGTILSYLIYKALMSGDLEFAYNLPIVAIVICVIAVLVLITVIMKYSINKINKQNTIETIRNDNI